MEGVLPYFYFVENCVLIFKDDNAVLKNHSQVLINVHKINNRHLNPKTEICDSLFRKSITSNVALGRWQPEEHLEGEVQPVESNPEGAA